MCYLLPALIIFPIIMALTTMALYRVRRIWLDGIVLTAGLAVAAASAWLYSVRPFNNLLLFNFGTRLVLDGLSHLLLLIANMVAFLIIIYAAAYMNKYSAKEKFYALFFLMLAGINGTILAGDLLSIFIFIELAAIAAYALVAFGKGKREMEAALKYFLMGELASILILAAIGIVYAFTGTFNIAEASPLFSDKAGYVRGMAAALFLAGFGMKAGLVPFHSWLPDAHPSAPAPISAMLSGVLIKALGVYALIRVFYNMLGMSPQLSSVLLALGTISMLVGVILALVQWDFKRLLAYHSISQIGYVILGIGLATPMGIMGGLFHLFNHSIFKSLLFLNAGAVEYKTGTRDLQELGGLSGAMPVTSKTALVASFSISGIPPFNGFWSKLFIILACVQAGKIWLAAAAVACSILTLASFLKVQKYVFFGKAHSTPQNKGDAPWPMGMSMIILALVCLLCGIFFPVVISVLINPAVVALANGVGYSKMILGGF